MLNIKELVAEYDEIPENICGGNLHIILDDFNVEDSSIIACYEFSKENKDYLGMLICSKLMGIDESERVEAITTKDFDYEPEIMDYYYF